MNRRERRHPGEDPVTEAQEEAQWSGFTRHIRATSQGKWLFRHRGAWIDRTVVESIFLVAALFGVALLVLSGVLMILKWLLS